MKPSGPLTITLIGALCLLTLPGRPVAAPRAQQPTAPPDDKAALKPTNHPPLPADVSQLWMAPSTTSTTSRTRTPRSATASEFAAAVKLEVDGDFAKALPIFSKESLQEGPLGHYAQYYKGLAELRLSRVSDARTTFQSLAAKQPVGFLVEATALRLAESEEAV